MERRTTKSRLLGPFVCKFCRRNFHSSDRVRMHVRSHRKYFKQKKSVSSEGCSGVNRTMCYDGDYSQNFPSKSISEDGITTLDESSTVEELPNQCTLYSGHNHRLETQPKESAGVLYQCQVIERPYQCEYCQKVFSYPSHLKRHIRIHTNEKPYQCKYCQKQFACGSNLKRHIRRYHTKEKSYQCEYCQKQFAHNSDLKRHIRLHTNEKTYQCDVCQTCFAQNGSLQRHIRRFHTKEKSYQCEYCQKRFTHNSDLKSHIGIHAKEKLYQCEVCQQCFAQNGNLKTHLGTHAHEYSQNLSSQFLSLVGSRTVVGRSAVVKMSNQCTPDTGQAKEIINVLYQCVYCQNAFSDKNALVSHMSSHTKVQPTQYVRCQQWFINYSNSTVPSEAKTPYQCKNCKKMIGDETSNIESDAKEKSYQSEYCPKGFVSYSDLVRRIETHIKEKPLQCEYCQERFRLNSHLKTHMRIHNKEKPYQCDYCQERFTYVGNLHRHVMIIHTKEKH